jgi:hypothetical protein
MTIEYAIMGTAVPRVDTVVRPTIIVWFQKDARKTLEFATLNKH